MSKEKQRVKPKKYVCEKCNREFNYHPYDLDSNGQIAVCGTCYDKKHNPIPDIN